MKKIVALLALLLGAALAGNAAAQYAIVAKVITACGTPPFTLTVGNSYNVFMDANGTLCTVSGGGGGGGAVTNAGVFAVQNTASTPAGSAIIGQVGIDQTTPGSTNGVDLVPSSATAVGITAVSSSAVESNHVLKGSAGNLYGVVATNTTTAGYLMVFNATSAPADGAVTPIYCVGLGIGQSVSLTGPANIPVVFSTGITAVFSTTGCFTKTASATAMFTGLVK